MLARWQALAVGLGTNTIRSLLQGGRWQQMYLGVYATHTGDPSRDARLWAAVLRAGPQAVLSHHSAAELDGLAVTPSTLIHVTVPAEQHLGRIPGVRIHRSSRIHLARHPSRTPPRTRIEETVIDLTQTARTFDAAFGALCQACGSRLNLMEQFGVCVELDGQAAHPGAQRWQDIRRDNALAADGIVTLRYSWPDVVQRPCGVAAQIAAVLRQRGWAGRPAPCRSGCPAGRR